MLPKIPKKDEIYMGLRGYRLLEVINSKEDVV